MPGLGLAARVGHYYGIIDGLTCCCNWFGPARLVFSYCHDGLWVTGVVAVSVVGPWYLRGGNTCCVYQIDTGVDVCLGGGVTWRCRSMFRQRPIGRCYSMLGGACQGSCSTTWQYIAYVDACLGLICLCWSLRWYNWWSGPLLWLGLDRLSGLWWLSMMDFGSLVWLPCPWLDQAPGWGNTCCVYQVYACDVWLVAV